MNDLKIPKTLRNKHRGKSSRPRIQQWIPRNDTRSSSNKRKKLNFIIIKNFVHPRHHQEGEKTTSRMGENVYGITYLLRVSCLQYINSYVTQQQRQFSSKVGIKFKWTFL